MGKEEEEEEEEEKDGGHGGWQDEEEGRLHFRDPRSGYTVILRDVESERKRVVKGKKEGEGVNTNERNQERHENRDRDTRCTREEKGRIQWRN